MDMASITRPTRPREEGVTVREAARRTRMPPHTVSYYGGNWGREGYGRFITPEIADAGQGTAKLFSRRNLVQLRVAFLLREAGLSEDETRHLLSAKGAGGKDWWDPKHPLGSDALLLVRGEPEWSGPERWHLCTTDLRIKPPTSWAAAVCQAAGLDCELVHARFQSGWQPRLPNDSTDCWILAGAHEAWVVNIGQIRKAMNE
jgi:DNA-binding transcriptional MerR regulator